VPARPGQAGRHAGDRAVPKRGTARARAAAFARLGAAAGVLLLCQCASLEHVAQPELLSHGPFDLYVYRPPGRAQHLALFLSGDGGWGSELGAIAERLSSAGTLVAGINVRRLLAAYRLDAAGCISAGTDLAELTHYLQEHYQLGHEAPVVIGHSAGATLAFVALAQSAAGTFAGAITLSFCEDLDLVKPLCPAATALHSVARSDGVRLLPPAAVPAPWIALHGLDDEVCPAPEARTFVDAITGARFIGLPGVTHSYHHMSRWWPQFQIAYRELAVPAAASPN
jgi:type IV secretory pathway VirJ component